MTMIIKKKRKKGVNLIYGSSDEIELDEIKEWIKKMLDGNYEIHKSLESTMKGYLIVFEELPEGEVNHYKQMKQMCIESEWLLKVHNQIKEVVK